MQEAKATILPVALPPATLRPLAFRTFTKKYNLTLTSAALQALATFIGRYCGSGWREKGLAERVLEETAKMWKKNGGGLIVEGDGKEFKDILQSFEGSMSGGTLMLRGSLSRQGSFDSQHSREKGLDGLVNGASDWSSSLGREDSQASLGLLDVEVDDADGDHEKDPRKWLKVVNAFEQPRLVYNANKNHFEKAASEPSLLPDPAHKTHLFRHRYNLTHQRLLRNESFQMPTVAPLKANALEGSVSTLSAAQKAYKLTPIANLLGLSGSSHILLGLLTMSPTATLAISDLTGSIALDLQHTRPIPEDGAWFSPGMIVIVDGIYKEKSSTGPSLGDGGAVGGTIGGKFIAISIGGPPCERREVTLGVHGFNRECGLNGGGGFGWVDFLGVGSERASGSRMKNLERAMFRRQTLGAALSGRGKMIILGELNLDNPKAIQALRKVLGIYGREPADRMPMAFMLVGNFVQHAVMAGGGSGGSIEYKEYFDSLASAMSDYPTVLQAAMFMFVPGDNDPWASAFSAGTATVLPRHGIPEVFTSRIKRAFSTANGEVERSSNATLGGEAVWTTNPTRITLFGPTQEIVVFRDDVSGRLRRSAIHFPLEKTGNGTTSQDACALQDTLSTDKAVVAAEAIVPTAAGDPSAEICSARKLVKTVLDQGYLSPFPLSNRPVLWDYAMSLQLYPLPTAMVLVDPETPPFAVTYEGCHVMNPGKLVPDGQKDLVRWMEYDAGTRRGKMREATF